MLKEKVAALLDEAFKEYPSLYLIDLKIKGNNEIVVIIDGDEGVSVQDCINVSRKVEHNLDREEEDFSLEVMSAGATEPLVNKRQYKKNERNAICRGKRNNKRRRLFVESMVSKSTTSRFLQREKRA